MLSRYVLACSARVLLEQVKVKVAKIYLMAKRPGWLRVRVDKGGRRQRKPHLCSPLISYNRHTPLAQISFSALPSHALKIKDGSYDLQQEYITC